MKGIRHTFLLSYICDDEERVYEFTAFSYRQAELIANQYCESHNALFIGLELTCTLCAAL